LTFDRAALRLPSGDLSSNRGVIRVSGTCRDKKTTGKKSKKTKK